MNAFSANKENARLLLGGIPRLDSIKEFLQSYVAVCVRNLVYFYMRELTRVKSANDPNL